MAFKTIGEILTKECKWPVTVNGTVVLMDYKQLSAWLAEKEAAKK